MFVEVQRDIPCFGDRFRMGEKQIGDHMEISPIFSMEISPVLKTPFSLDDGHGALSHMANHKLVGKLVGNLKALGKDGLPKELHKYCGPAGRELLLRLPQPDTRQRM
jgi:hypothetical protein